MAPLQTIDDLTAGKYIEFARKLSERGLTNQQTLESPAKIAGFDPLGGRAVELTLCPAKPNTGIWFVLTDEDINLDDRIQSEEELGIETFPEDSLLNADIRYASYRYSGVLLSNKGLRLLYPEHLLGTLYAYDINNLIIVVRRFLSDKDTLKKEKLIGKLVSYISMDHHSQHKYFETFAVPQWENVTLEIVKAITEVGIKEQESPIDVYTIKEPFEFILEPIKKKYRDWPQRIRLEPDHQGRLIIKAITDYSPVSTHQEVEVEIDPLNFLTQVSEARSLFKDNYISGFRIPLLLLEFFRVGKLINPELGYGCGMTPNHFVLPDAEDKKRYHNLDRYIYNGQLSEIARHNALDRLADLSLLEGSLKGVLRGVYFGSNRLRHEGSILGLQKALEQGVFVKLN